ncbi:serine hydrolase, partial [Bacteroides thetaiotaomicron]
AAICKAPLVYEPGTKTVYSDVDYMLLCFIVEQVVGKGLDEFLKETFWDPMGLTHMTYNPLENGFTKEQTAATELQGNPRGEDQHGQRISFRNVRTDTVWGEVHDEKAYYAMGGVSGHAGLFSNAEDLARLAQTMLNPTGYGTHRLFGANVNEYFVSRKDSSATWGQGWWRQGDCGRPWYFGVQASRGTIGHQGWTGTLPVVAPEEDLVVVVLPNKKNSPVIDNTVDANDFYSDNMVLGALGGVVGMVYDALRSSGDAMDSTVLQMAHDRIRLMMSHEDKYDEGVHMNDAFALVDLAVTRTEERKSEVTRANAALALKNLKDFVAIYIVRQENK